MKNEKSCENCRYFFQHYIQTNTNYRAVLCGHCFHGKNKKYAPSFLCEQWQDNTVRNEQRKKTINDILEAMAENLNYIAMILRNEKE